MYVTVSEQTDTKLCLNRGPTTRSWSILSGLVALGVGAAYYGSDFILWKFGYIMGSVFLGLTILEEWEECIFDKESGKVTVSKQNIFQKFKCQEEPRKVSANISEIVDVVVEEDKIRYAGDAYYVVLKFDEGYSIGVTDTATLEDNSEHKHIASVIRAFLNLDETTEPEPFREAPVEESSSSGDDFEYVDKSELVGQPEVNG